MRDYVDHRRRVGELVLPGALLVIILGFVPALTAYTYLAFYALLLAVIVDALVVTVPAPAPGKDRFPDEPTKGIALLRRDAQPADPPHARAEAAASRSGSRI